MKNFTKIISVIVLLVMVSCNQDNYLLYTDSAKIQFGPEERFIYSSGDVQLRDTVKPYTFVYEADNIAQDTVYFDIYAVGGPADTDRAYKLVQVDVADEFNAVAGTHYKGFNDADMRNEYVIKAGEVHAFVPVVLLRDPSLKEESKVILEFNVEANENFETGELDKLWRRVEFTDMLSRPAAWNSIVERYYFGKYSVTKHQWMIDQTGEKWDEEFINEVYHSYSYMTFWRVKFKTLLIEYNNAHPGDPLTDEDGEVVVFP